MKRILQKISEISGMDIKKLLTKENMLVLFFGGILIYVIMLPTKPVNTSYREKEHNNIYEQEINEEKVNIEENTVQKTDDKEYQAQLEKELEDFLKQVEGIGDVKVLIYMGASQKYVVEKDVPTSNTTKSDTSENTKSEKTVYTVNSYGEDIPFVVQTINPEIKGVVVAAQGVDTEDTRLRIIRLVMALYGIDANKIEVIGLK
ncbi:MAG: hypothetical protein IIX45_04380 [Lachnospiraceae bacterium]|nr:hypothetical protein [Lachnospiraceae bacterium]MBQ2117339.1 hypothetical protein [Lachnospiraceae bacterium]MBQ2407147.1 hypothetical protein [Lachnospiraceae bacterium]